MTSLEQKLADVLLSIEQARSAGSSHLLTALLQRKRVISEALAAPEQSWLPPEVLIASRIQHTRRASERTLTPVLCD